MMFIPRQMVVEAVLSVKAFRKCRSLDLGMETEDTVSP
jgi:hypothetical protein